jgi:glycosyltransferase involved in cell wall biosynthesis
MVKISVIVPVYNSEDFIEESLGSIINQTFKDIEIICVDDGSTDDSLKILNRLASSDSRIKVFSQENQGASVARNNGLKKVSGEYVYFFDADDYLLEDGLEKVYANAINNDSDLVIFNFDIYDGDVLLRHSKLDIAQKFSGVDFNHFTFNYKDHRKLAFNGPTSLWYKLYKRELLDRGDCFEFPVGIIHNDIPFHVKAILMASKISYVDEYLYHYRTDNPNSISNNRLKRYKDIFCNIAIVEDFLKSKDLLEDLREEFDYLKADQISYQIRGRDNRYFEIAKEWLSDVDLDDNQYIYPNLHFKVSSILNSNSIEEYNYKMELKSLNNRIDRLSKENEKLKNENKKLKEDLLKTNKKSRDDLLKANDKNKEILDSNSWKITEPLRKLRQFFKSSE